MKFIVISIYSLFKVELHRLQVIFPEDGEPIHKFNHDMQISLTNIIQPNPFSVGVKYTPLFLLHGALGLDGFHTEELVQGYVHIFIPVTYSDIEPEMIVFGMLDFQNILFYPESCLEY